MWQFDKFKEDRMMKTQRFSTVEDFVDDLFILRQYALRQYA